MTLPGTDAVARFQLNEDMFDKFLNYPGTYTNKFGVEVATLQSLNDSFTNFNVNVVAYGTVLDGTKETTGTDNTTAFQAYITAKQAFSLKYGLSSTYNNKYGIYPDYPIVSLTGKVMNPRLAQTNLVVGQEYLAPWYKHFKRSSSFGNQVDEIGPFNIVISGDSTVAGFNASAADYYPASLLNSSAIANGYRNCTIIDHSLSGFDAKSWQDLDWHSNHPGVEYRNYALDLAANPDLYIIRWGVNDFAYPEWVDAALDDIRAGLVKIRALKTAAELPIILMSPCSTSDVPNNRTEIANEMANKGFRQIARDFQCCFIDTYGMYQDSHSGSFYMDSLPGHVHPTDEIYALINKLLADVVFPTNLASSKNNGIYNMGSFYRILNPSTVSPNHFFQGITFDRMDVGANNGGPYNGFLFSFKNSEKGILQFSTSLPGVTAGIGISGRVHFGATAGPWLGAEFDAASWLKATYTTGGIWLQTSLEGRAFLNGDVYGGTFGADVIVATIPAGYRPLHKVEGFCCTGTADTIARFGIELNGDIHIYEFTDPKVAVKFSGISWKMA